MKIIFGFAALLAASAMVPANAAVTVHTSAFITGATNYNGFEGMGATSSFPANTPYTEDGITVEYIGSASIWTTSQVMEGNYSWYPAGGGNGFTRVTFNDATAVQFAMGSGLFGGSPALQYLVLHDGRLIAAGEITGVSTYTGFGYYGFSGMTMDELRLQVQIGPGNAFNPTGYEAGAYDAFTTAGTVPEPASWAMLIAGFGLTGAAMRRRRSAAVAA
jgi:PEP-CTERM motif